MATKPELWPHQREAERFVEGRDAAMLAMVMRSGKSRVTVDVLEDRHARNVLLLCPKSVVNVWPEQFEQYSNNGTQVLPLAKGTIKKRTEQAATFLAEGSGKPHSKVVVLNYDTIASPHGKPFIEWAKQVSWDALVMDESHRLKTPGGVASRIVARLAQEFKYEKGQGGYGVPKIPFRLALTGTPMPHSPLDVYAQYRILDPAIYGTSFNRFQNTYAEIDHRFGFPLIRGYKNLEQLRERFYQIAFEVGPEVLNLPEPLHIPRYCEMTPAGMKVYRELDRDFYAQVDAGEITASNAMVKALRLQQATSGFAKLADGGDEVPIDNSKKALLADILLDLNEPVVIFCRFKHDLLAVHEAAKGLERPSLELSGDRNDLAAFQDGEADIIAVQTQAGGVGIDLSRAKIAIYYSLGLSLGDHLQSLSRLQKRGLDYSPVYYYLLAANTVDLKVFRALQQRKEVIDEVLKR